MRDPGNKVDKKQAQNDAMNVKLTIRWKKPLRGLFLGSVYVFNLTSDFRFVTSAVIYVKHKNMVHPAKVVHFINNSSQSYHSPQDINSNIQLNSK